MSTRVLRHPHCRYLILDEFEIVRPKVILLFANLMAI